MLRRCLQVHAFNATGHYQTAMRMRQQRAPNNRQLPQQAADAPHNAQVSGSRLRSSGAQQGRQRLHQAFQERVQQLGLLLVLADLERGGVGGVERERA